MRMDDPLLRQIMRNRAHCSKCDHEHLVGSCGCGCSENPSGVRSDDPLARALGFVVPSCKEEEGHDHKVGGHGKRRERTKRSRTGLLGTILQAPFAMIGLD
jgi:hypothetical protein